VADEDVKDAGSSPAGEQPVDQTDATVTGAQGDDRPVQNVVAEFNRKFAKTQQQLDTVLQWIASQAVTQQPSAPRQADKTQVSDEDLWALAQQGDRQAFELYQERIADRRIKQDNAQQRKASMTQNQLAVYAGKYPVLNNPQHPLAQHVTAIYQALLGNGYAAGQDTLLEAIKLGVADRPDLIAAEYNAGGNAREGVRRSATQTAQSGVTGASHRNPTTPQTTQSKPLSPEQRDLAKRMGVKDGRKSIERFLQRQENGQSSLGGVRAFVDETEI
jgi:hypothetical protein